MDSLPVTRKSITTSRGYSYTYYFAKPVVSEPFLLFIHGFPSTAYDWRHQIRFFKEQGYGLIVPDMLGYGQSDKPTDPTVYASSLICKDLVDILNAEQADRVIAVGHDMGSKIASRLANIYPDRFLAFAFVAVGYIAPSPGVSFQDVLAHLTQLAGYEVFGYWPWFAEDGAHKAVEEHFDSFYSVVIAADETLWKSVLAPTGKLRAWVEANQTTPPALYLTEEEVKTQKKLLLDGGFQAPFCWYKILTSSIDSDDSKSIPQENYFINKPVFFVAAKRDHVALPSAGIASAKRFCKSQLTVHEYDTAHWVAWEAKDQLNKDLLTWISSIDK